MSITADPRPAPPITGAPPVRQDRGATAQPATAPAGAAKRRGPHVLVASTALVAAGLLAILGIVLASNASFAKTYAGDQLRQQRITFKAADALTAKEKRSSCLVRYAGQQLTTGKQAECYANDFIGLHVTTIANGQTYAELGTPERALTARVAAAEKAGDPALPELQKQLTALRSQRSTLFQGETSRGLLLTTFGFSDLGAKAGQAATTAYAAAGLLVLLAAASLALRARSKAGAVRAAATSHGLTTPAA